MQGQRTYIAAIALFCILFGRKAAAQNLVPNPGFEHTGPYKAYGWDQPSGKYFHLSLAAFRNFNKVNSICLLNTSEGSEYLQTQLKVPLERGKKYHISLWVFPGDPGMQNVECLFANHPYTIQDRMFIFAKPQLKFRLRADSAHYWAYLDTTYTADGTEKYFLIGHFFSKADTGSTAAAALIFRKISQQQDKSLQVVHDSFNRLYPVWTNEMEKRNNKKEKTVFNTRVAELSRLEKTAVDSVYQHYMQMIDSARLNYHIVQPYHYRPQFDNICIAPIWKDGSYSCQDTSRAVATADDNRIPLNDLTFETDKAVIQPISFEELDQLADYLRSKPKIRVQINGYTDNVGSAEHNRQLSTERAKAVVDYLAAKGVARTRLNYKGFGADDPVATNDTEKGRQLNRRVEMQILNE